MGNYLDTLAPEERAELGDALLEDEAAHNPRGVERRLQAVFAKLSGEGVFEGLTEAQVRAAMREVAEDLGLSPGRGLS